MKVVWTRRYLQELEALGDFIALKNPSAAARVVKAVHGNVAALLSDNPFIGRPGHILGTRELVISGTPYIVAYRVRDDSVEVLFVQHGAREWPEEI